jgi:hypothetical protein
MKRMSGFFQRLAGEKVRDTVEVVPPMGSKLPKSWEGRVSLVPTSYFVDVPQVTRRPTIRETRNNTRNITNRTLAIYAAVPAMPQNPKKPASNATIKKVTDQPNIINLSLSVV